jgi:hypothetical protein
MAEKRGNKDAGINRRLHDPVQTRHKFALLSSVRTCIIQGKASVSQSILDRDNATIVKVTAINCLAYAG